jgi:hypothetical protein
MWSFVVMAAGLAAVVALCVALTRMPGLSAGAARGARMFSRPPVMLCRLAAGAVEIIVARPARAHGLRPVLYAGWCATMLLPLALVVGVSLIWSGRPADPGYLLIVAALFQLLVLGAAFIVAHEDFDVMDGVIDNGGRTIGGGAREVMRLPMIAASLVLFFVYVAAMAWWLVAVRGLPIFAARPDSGASLVDFALAGLRALPTGWLVGGASWLTGEDTTLVFTGHPAAVAFRLAVAAAGMLILVGFAVVAVQGAWQRRRMVAQLGKAAAVPDEALLDRARRAPPGIRRAILYAAMVPDGRRQMRLIAAARQIGILDLPAAFCRHLEPCDEDVQRFGLEQVSDFYKRCQKQFDPATCAAILRQGTRLVARGRLDAEAMKRLLLVMSMILVTKRDALALDEAFRLRTREAIGKELERARAKDDPALRGLLREVRDILVGGQPSRRAAPSAAAAPRTAPRPEAAVVRRLSAGEDRGARRDSPAMTAP